MNIVLLYASALALSFSGPLKIENDGKSSEIRKDLPGVAVLKPDGIYGFSYYARSDYPAHCLAGTGFAALGRSEPGDGMWRRRHSVFAVPSRGKPVHARFHFGQWKPNGIVEVKEVELVQLRAEYLKSEGLELGGGERLDGNEYLFSFPFGQEGRSPARPLYRFECPFNGRLWWFNPGSKVVYRHRLDGRRFLGAKVFVGTSDWSDAKGEVSVEVSSDGTSWRNVGTVVARTAIHKELPKEMFPCESVYVRIVGGTNGTLQVAHYNLKGMVDGKPLRMFGETRFVEKSNGKLFAQVGRSFYDDEGYGALLASGDGANLWAAVSGRKVVQTRPAPTKKGRGLLMRTAANEAESVQLVVRAEEDIKSARVRLREELCADSGFCLPLSAVDVKRIGYVDVRHPTDFGGLPIATPDKLLPYAGEAVAVGKGKNQPFWITVRPPKGTGKGVYRGVVDVDVVFRNGVRRQFAIPLNVEVFGFELPDVMTCQTAFGLSPSLIVKAHGIKENTPEFRDLAERYFKAMSENHLSPYFPAFLAHWRVTWNGDVPVFDFSEWERELDRVFSKYHFNAFMVWLPGLGQCSMSSRQNPEFMGLKPGDPRYEKRLGAYLAAMEGFLKRKGLLDKAYAYVYDEPLASEYDLVKFGYNFLAKHAPGLRRMLPALAHSAFRDLDGAVNLWCPQIQYLSSPELKRQRERGDMMWWYVCNNPKSPYVCDFIDHPAPELRIWLWQTWKEKVGGVLIWDVFNWRGQTKHPDQNGEGRFLYPPEECATKAGVVADPVRSVRITHLRDGLEDYEYFSMLKRLSPSNPLLQVPDSVTSAMTEFAFDSSAMEAHRLRLAREIERLDSLK